jgi:hypothetical protein
MKTLSALFFLSLGVLLSGCCKKDTTPQPLNQLPATTQEGKNTFGCLLNGQAWTPKGYNGTSNYTVFYDPEYANGTLNISTYSYPDKDEKDKQTITLFSDNLSKVGTYPLTIINQQEALFSDRKTKCYFLQGESHFRDGILTITRLDLNKGIISGTFEFTLAKPGCDTIRVTNGRFDKKL